MTVKLLWLLTISTLQLLPLRPISSSSLPLCSRARICRDHCSTRYDSHVLKKANDWLPNSTWYPTKGDGEVFGLKLGDTVACLSEGTYAEYTAAPAIRTVKLPTSISTSIAAASFQQGLTALTLIREAYHVKRNDWVLVHAAAGGTGQWLVRLLRIVGAHTIGTASTAEKIEVARQAGATHTIQYTKEDVKSRVMELTGNKGVSVVFDGVGKSTFDLSLDVIARKGSLICFGNASGSPEPLVLARLSPKNLRLMRPMLLGFVQMREEFIRYTEELFGLMERHESNIPYEVYPLSGASQAQRDLERRGTTGKLILSTST